MIFIVGSIASRMDKDSIPVSTVCRMDKYVTLVQSFRTENYSTSNEVNVEITVKVMVEKYFRR